MNYNMFSEIDYFTNFKGKNEQGLIDNSPIGLNNYNENVNNNKLKLYNPYEGYLRGNLFKNLYNGYKNYQPAKLSIKNEQEEALLNIGEISFAAHDLRLYLDNFPNDKEALGLFNKYNKMEAELIKNYERRYGPISIMSNDMKLVPFKWEQDMWPWDK